MKIKEYPVAGSAKNWWILVDGEGRVIAGPFPRWEQVASAFKYRNKTGENHCISTTNQGADTMAHTITIKAGQRAWLAVHTDPTIMELFGTDTLPTPFLLQTPMEVVQVELAQLNPDCWVK